MKSNILMYKGVTLTANQDPVEIDQISLIELKVIQEVGAISYWVG